MDDVAPKPRGGLTDEDIAKIIEEKKLELLPTGKHHVSFSEMRDWQDCSFRHRLKHVLKIDLGDESAPLMDFGTAAHASCEDFLQTRKMDPTISEKMIRAVWEEKKLIKGYEPETVERYVTESNNVLADVPAWMEETFPDWEFVDAEHYLYEQIEGKPHAFKGFIDGIIRCKGPRGKMLTWLLDWKTTSWGWKAEKKSDPIVCAQLVLYKNYWSTKTGTDPKDVRCGFVLLKRTAKEGKHCELVTTSVGDVTTGRSLKVINNMVTSVKRGIAIKNRANCTWCDYYNTEHCT